MSTTKHPKSKSLKHIYPHSLAQGGNSYEVRVAMRRKRVVSRHFPSLNSAIKYRDMLLKQREMKAALKASY